MIARPINKCRLCGQKNLLPVGSLGTMALAGVFSRSKRQNVPRGPLTLLKCHGPVSGACGLVQLAHTYDKRLLFGRTYGYRSGLNASMVRHLQALARDILRRVRLEPGDTVLDIGSSDGTLLRSFANRNLDLLGIDPLAGKFRNYYPGKTRILTSYFDGHAVARALGGKKAKVITAIALLYDMNDPTQFMKEASGHLDPKGIMVVELSYLSSMLRNAAYDTVCHEHAAYYGLRQLCLLASTAGLKLIDASVNSVNGGSLRVYLSRMGVDKKGVAPRVGYLLRQEKKMRLDTLATYRDFYERALSHGQNLRRIIRDLRAQGQRIAAYGASTKGNVLLQFCGLTQKDIVFAAEINEEKWGSFCPGTKIPIVSEDEAHAHPPDIYLVLPWHFRRHILAKERSFLKRGGSLLFPWPKIELIGPAAHKIKIR